MALNVYLGGTWTAEQDHHLYLDEAISGVNGPGMPGRVGPSGQSPYLTSQIKELAVDPRNADVVYAGSRSWVTASVYKTEDGGARWSRATLQDGSSGAGS